MERSRVFMRLCETFKTTSLPSKSLRVPFKPVTALHLHARHNTRRSPDLQTLSLDTAARDPQGTALPSGSAFSASGIQCSAVSQPQLLGIVQHVLKQSVLLGLCKASLLKCVSSGVFLSAKPWTALHVTRFGDLAAVISLHVQAYPNLADYVQAFPQQHCQRGLILMHLAMS